MPGYDNKITNPIFLRKNKLIFAFIFSALAVLLLDSNLTVFCTPQRNRIIDISNIDFYLIYLIIFIIINSVLLRDIRTFGFFKSKINKYLYIATLSNQIFISSMLLLIYLQIRTLSGYNSLLIQLIIYSSLSVSILLLSIVSLRFIRWSSFRSYSILLFGIVMFIFAINTSIGLLYLNQVSLSHTYIIKPISCRTMYASLEHATPTLTFQLSQLYDITSILSFVLAWLATVLLLKQYSGRIKKRHTGF